jgi:hypothetical protein
MFRDLGTNAMMIIFYLILNMILLETWKGIEPNINIPDYNFFQKYRKKKKRSKRFSVGIIVAYKSVLHKGITEIKDITASENRLWLKLDKHCFLVLTKIFTYVLVTYHQLTHFTII